MTRIELSERIDEAPGASATLTLPFERRQRSRLLATLDDGREAALFLPRGTVLRGGDALRGTSGEVVLVRAADEALSVVRSPDPRALARAAYHLGNRHVPLEIGEGWLRYEHDHVLDAMVRELGLEVSFERAPFEPEGGAHAHGHSARAHAHHHAHDDPHEHT